MFEITREYVIAQSAHMELLQNLIEDLYEDYEPIGEYQSYITSDGIKYYFQQLKRKRKEYEYNPTRITVEKSIEAFENICSQLSVDGFEPKNDVEVIYDENKIPIFSQSWERTEK